ncbi:TetR family transcriptional regulator [Ferrimonas aestuarii]|uniref:TetR family transcriptional regulator n=1 Tax=Ferrimonas aestuarii TaxID=2569539 RepID=A0A4U1BHR6_9GAMM|nr:TetR family transcriptional regulator [Ferrimonas aestuarii]TKB50817.1 TetR family transcriptional regulator [Ferrimonas aestuarii]
MARKTKAEAEKTRELLLDTALKLFSEKGVANTTLAQIATACGMTRGAIYWHFDDKAAMLHAMFESSITPEMQRIWDLIGDEGADPINTLLEATWVFWSELRRDSNLKQVMILYNQAEQIPELCEKLDELHCQEDSHIRQVLSLAKSKGLLHSQMSVDSAVIAFYSFHMGFTNLVLRPRSSTRHMDVEQVFKEMIAGFERSIRA